MSFLHVLDFLRATTFFQSTQTLSKVYQEQLFLDYPL